MCFQFNFKILTQKIMMITSRSSAHGKVLQTLQVLASLFSYDILHHTKINNIKVIN